MNLELLNFLLYFFPLLFYLKKYKTIDLYVVLLVAYAFTAFMCYLNILSSNSSYKHTTLFPYLYLATCIFISLFPFKRLTIPSSFSLRETPLIKYMTWIYILAGVYAAYSTIPDTIALFIMDEWNTLRNTLYNDADMIELYHSPFEKLCKNITSYLSPFGIVMAFYQLQKPKKNIYLIISLFAVWIVNTFLSATLVASRGMVANLMLKFAMLFVLFKNCIDAKTRKYAITLSFVIGIFFLIYTIIISVSRFGEDSAGNSIFEYLGHSMIVFNERLMGCMHDYAWGKYFFEYFYSMLGIDSTIDYTSLGAKANTAFFTYVGSFYIDFGPYFTLPFLALVSLFVNKFTKQSVPTFSSMVIIVYFASFFLSGIFVIGTGAALQWVMVYVVYRMIKFSEK